MPGKSCKLGPFKAEKLTQHGEATLLRPTSTINAHREAVRFPLEDYTYA